MNPFNAALVFLALGASVLPALAQDRLPRAGGPVAGVTVIEEAPAPRRPRSGGVVVQAPTALFAFDTTDVIVDVSAGDDALGLCGRKYCGAGYAR
jgi:hypothetical protein